MPNSDAESVLNQRNKDLAQKSKREIQLGNQWQREQLTVKEESSKQKVMNGGR